MLSPGRLVGDAAPARPERAQPGKRSARLIWLRIALAGLVLGLVLLPGEIWSSPSSDYTQNGFDPGLVHMDPGNRHTFDPFLIIANGTWEACPCEPGTELTISGDQLSDSTGRSPEGAPVLADTRVLVDGEPAILYLVTPVQINFDLPVDAEPPVATVAVETHGSVGPTDTVAVGYESASVVDSIEIDNARLALSPGPGQEPAVHILTSPLSFTASFTAVVSRRDGDAAPLSVKVWNPRNFSSLELVFQPTQRVDARFVESKGRPAKTDFISSYELGEPYDVTFEWHRGEFASITLVDGDVTHSATVTADEAPALLDAYRPSLTVSASGHSGESSAILTNYHLELTPMRFTTLRVADTWTPGIVLALLALALLLITLRAGQLKRGLRPMLLAPQRLATGVQSFSAGLRRRDVLVATSIAATYVGLNGFLFTLGSHPFDMGSQTIWAYSAAHHGLTDLYYVSQTATLADVWNGMPYHEAVFPYNIGMSYYFWFIGVFHDAFFPQPSPQTESLAITIKAFNLAFLLADAALVYALTRRLKPEATLLPWGLGAALLLNPAFIFDTAIWGETEAVPLFFLLASLLAALKDRPGIGWSMLALAFLTKQTILIAVLVIGIYYLIRFPWRRNLSSVSLAMIPVALAILPFAFNGYPPSIAIDPTLAALWVHGGTGAERIFQVVSYDAFNVWTLIPYLADGATGIERFRYPDNGPEIGGLSYHSIGGLLLVLSVLSLVAVLFIRRRTVNARPGLIFVLIAAAFLVELVVPTRTLSRYFLFVIAFGCFGISERPRWPAALAIASLTQTSLVGMWGSMALVLEDFPSHAPALAPQNNPVSALMVTLSTSDAFMTIAVLLNLMSLLAWASYLLVFAAPEARPTTEKSPARATQALVPDLGRDRDVVSESAVMQRGRSRSRLNLGTKYR